MVNEEQKLSAAPLIKVVCDNQDLLLIIDHILDLGGKSCRARQWWVTMKAGSDVR